MSSQTPTDGDPKALALKPRVCAVSYLNTVPLVWGMLHGPQRGLFDLSFCLPSECADRLENGTADIGIVPSIELPRLGLEVIRGAGIASRGPVRSILLISKAPFGRIRTLAADSSSRTSVMLARIFLAERHGAEPEVLTMPPELDRMLEAADAALIIGDPALRVDPGALPYQVADLGEEWMRMTGKSMVFAVWAGRPGVPCSALEAAFSGSCRLGLEHVEEIVRTESRRRRISERLARRYLTRNVVCELSENDYQGLEAFLEHASRTVTALLPGKKPSICWQAMI